jgi:hypothetical protein
MKTATFTSTISPQLLSWMAKHAKETKKTRRLILEEALTKYRTEEVRLKMKADFVRVSKDKEVLDLTEWGMNDYHNIVTS